MCNLYTIPGRADEIYLTLLADKVPDWIPDVSLPMVYAFARPIAPIILANGECVPASWTYMPPAPKGDATKGWWTQTYNTKAEEMFQKRTWSEPAVQRRCLVPAVAYHEHQHRAGKVKVPYRFEWSGGRAFLLAGLWKFWEDDETYRFSILTMEPNRLNRRIHNSNPRQPVVIPIALKDLYLQGRDTLSVQPFLAPRDDDGFTAEIGVGLNGKRPENLPPEPDIDEGGSLFD